MSVFDKGNYQGCPCRRCGAVIGDYSRSGLCRKCWREQHPGKDRRKGERRYYCPICGAPTVTPGECAPCQHNETDRLTKYRTFENLAEHRHVYLKHYGGLPDDYIVHHLNGLKGDNRIENLCALPRSEHDTKHIVRELQKRIRELEGR
jgi:hypothetical protein